MAILIIYPDMELEPYVDVLLNLEPKLDIRVWPQIGNADDIEFAIAWNHPRFAQFALCAEDGWDKERRFDGRKFYQ